MAYHAAEESRRIIAEGVDPDPGRLTRRRRFFPMAVDVDGDAAATLFARRGVSGRPQLDTWALVRQAGRWEILGGGGGDASEELFVRRPAAVTIGGHLASLGGGSTSRNADRLMPWGGKWVHYATYLTAVEVAAVSVNGERRLDVAVHGHIVVVWSERRPPNLRVLGQDGRMLASVVPTID